MIVIRLRRTGKKGQPTYRIVVADNRAPIYGKYIEMLGTYNPNTKAIVLNKEKSLEWLKRGAKPTNTMAKILVKQEVQHPSIVVKKFRAVSKKELEAQKAQEEKERAEEQAKKEAAKEAFEQQVEQEKAAPKEDKLQQMAEESIQEVKEEEAQKEAEKTETAEVKEKAKEEHEAEKPAEEKPKEEPKEK